MLSELRFKIEANGTLAQLARSQGRYDFCDFSIVESDRGDRDRLRIQLAAFPNGSSREGLWGVNSSAPSTVMCMSSSRRTPNSPLM